MKYLTLVYPRSPYLVVSLLLLALAYTNSASPQNSPRAMGRADALAPERESKPNITGVVDSNSFDEAMEEWLMAPPLWQGNINLPIPCEIGHLDPDFGSPLVFMPDVRSIALCGGKSVEIRESRTGRLIRALGPHDHPTSFVSVSSDGTLVAVTVDIGLRQRGSEPGSDTHVEGGCDGKGCVFIWNVQAGTLRATLHGEDREITRTEFSPDGSRIMTFERGNIARLWDVATGRWLATFDALYTGSLGSADLPPRTWAAFCVNGVTTVSAHELVFRDLSGKARFPVSSLARFSSPIAQIDIAPDGRLAITGVIARNEPLFWTQWLATNPPIEGSSSESCGRAYVNPLLLPGRFVDLSSTYSRPLFSPDGKQLVAIRSRRDAKELAFLDVINARVEHCEQFGASGNECRSILCTADASEFRYGFSPDARLLAILAPRFGFLDVHTYKWLSIRKAIAYQFPDRRDWRAYLLSSDWSLLAVIPPLFARDASGFEIWDLRAVIAASKREEALGMD